MYIRAFIFVSTKSKILKFQKSSKSAVHHDATKQIYLYIRLTYIPVLKNHAFTSKITFFVELRFFN